MRQIQRAIGEQHLEDIEEQSRRGDRDSSSSPSSGASSPSSSLVRGRSRSWSCPLSCPVSTDALSRDAAARCNASSPPSSSSRLVVSMISRLVLLPQARTFCDFQFSVFTLTSVVVDNYTYKYIQTSIYRV